MAEHDDVDIYFVPTSATRDELYCEAPITADDTEQSPTLWNRLRSAFKQAVDEGEEQPGSDSDRAPVAERSRLRRAITRSIATVVAEQRVLWRLRSASSAQLTHPDDLSGPEAIERARRELAADLTKHRNWSVIDGLLAAITGPALFVVPGPNVVGFYFFFRAMGHFLAYLGARRGLSTVRWTARPSAALTELRRALALDPDERGRHVEAIAGELGLERLPKFVARLCDRTPA